MIPTLLLLTTQTKPKPKQVLGRLAAYVARAKTLQAEYVLTSPSIQGQGKAVLSYNRPDALNYSIKWGPIDYRFVGNTTHGFWDANYVTKTYDSADEWAFSFPFSRGVSGAPRLFEPGYLLDGTLNCFPVSQAMVVGKSVVNGVQTDDVRALGMNYKVDLFISDQGKPVRCALLIGTMTLQADLASINVNGRIDPSLFGSDPPTGFHEYTLAYPEQPITVSQKFPLAGWQQKGKADFSGKCLVVVTTAACQPSAKAAPVLANLSAKRVFPIVVASLDGNGGVPAALSSYPVLYDPTKKLAERVNAPGTPMFYLLDHDGTVIRVWYGYDPDNADGFEKDVLDAASGKNTDSG